MPYNQVSEITQEGLLMYLEANFPANAGNYVVSDPAKGRYFINDNGTITSHAVSSLDACREWIHTKRTEAAVPQHTEWNPANN